MRGCRQSDKFESLEENNNEFFQYVNGVSRNCSTLAPPQPSEPLNQQKMHQFLASIYQSKRIKNTSSIRFYTQQDVQEKAITKSVRKNQQLDLVSTNKIELPLMAKTSSQNFRNSPKSNIKRVSIVLSAHSGVKESEEALESFLIYKPKLRKVDQKYRFQVSGRSRSLETSQQFGKDMPKVGPNIPQTHTTKILEKLNLNRRMNRLSGTKYFRNHSSLLNPTKASKIPFKRSETPNIELKPHCIGIGEEQRNIPSPPPGKHSSEFVNRKRRLQKFRIKI